MVAYITMILLNKIWMFGFLWKHHVYACHYNYLLFIITSRQIMFFLSQGPHCLLFILKKLLGDKFRRLWGVGGMLSATFLSGVHLYMKRWKNYPIIYICFSLARVKLKIKSDQLNGIFWLFLFVVSSPPVFVSSLCVFILLPSDFLR